MVKSVMLKSINPHQNGEISSFTKFGEKKRRRDLGDTGDTRDTLRQVSGFGEDSAMKTKAMTCHGGYRGLEGLDANSEVTWTLGCAI